MSDYKPGLCGCVRDAAATIMLWCYFTLGFIFFFSPFYLLAYFLSKKRTLAFQSLNNRFYRGFFLLARRVIPLHTWYIQGDVRKIRSSVIVCNHLSYLDPLIMISLFKKQTTIVKARFFKFPIFGRMIDLSGYIPSSSGGGLGDMMISRIDNISSYLKEGGNLFVFPEGTRSKTGRIGGLNRGAFKIARLSRAPIHVLFMENTDKLFKPGRFLFQTGMKNRIRVESLGVIDPDYDDETFNLSSLMDRVSRMLAERSDISERS